MPNIKTVTDALETLTFGGRIAEDERDQLANYFIKTDQWRQVRGGSVDIVYGAKGAGKSALYFLLLSNEAELAGDSINLITAENPRGATVFSNLATDPPASERDFVEMWKLYFLALVGRFLGALAHPPEPATKLIESLRNAGLLAAPGGLKGLLLAVREFALRFSGVEGGLKFDAQTSTPEFSGKFAFENTPTPSQSQTALSLEDLYEITNKCLCMIGKTVWILLDRLDIAFSDTPVLEKNALRALFIAYRDLQAYDQLKLKIFLRTDIWRRLSEEGFREASHITRTVTIKWERTSLLNLIIRRSLQNENLRLFYGVNESTVTSTAEQDGLFYRMFPDQIDSGPNKPKTLDWILSRVQDGSKQPAPREVIHFLNTSRDLQFRSLELGEPEPPSEALFSRSALKDALPEVSKVRLEQTLYAEYPNLKPYCEALRKAKTQHSPDTLASIWKVPVDEAAGVARKLVDVGFFEERGNREVPEFWVPFLYRDSLDMVQGTAE